MYTCFLTCSNMLNFSWPGKKMPWKQHAGMQVMKHFFMAQDTVEELGAMGTNAVDDFDWLVQLRYYIEAN